MSATRVSIVIPVAPGSQHLDRCLDAIRAQRYDADAIEVWTVAYAGAATPRPARSWPGLKRRAVERESAYAARNLAAAEASGDVLLFTEPECVPAPGWIGAHVQRLGGDGPSIGVGTLAAARPSAAAARFLAYERTRDAWVFSAGAWQHRFGRPKNMAVTRERFASHGPFRDVVRGADSSFVQKVARELSPDEVALVPDAVVHYPALDRLGSCFRDRYRHNHAMQVHQSSHAAPIAFAQRLRFFRQTVRRNGYGPLDAALLFAAIGAGIVAFRAGAWGARFERQR